MVTFDYLASTKNRWFLQLRSKENWNLFFGQDAYRQLKNNIWVLFCLFFLLFLTDFRTNNDKMEYIEI